MKTTEKNEYDDLLRKVPDIENDSLKIKKPREPSKEELEELRKKYEEALDSINKGTIFE